MVLAANIAINVALFLLVLMTLGREAAALVAFLQVIGLRISVKES